MPEKSPCGSWTRCQSPTPPASTGSSASAERRLGDRPGDPRHGDVHGVAQPDVDVPAAVGAVVRRQPGHAQHQVVGQPLVGRPLGPVHAARRGASRSIRARQQRGQGAVEVEAVATPPGRGDAGRRRRRDRAARRALVDPERLPRDPLDVALVDASQSVRRGRLGLQPQPGEVAGDDVGRGVIGAGARPARRGGARRGGRRAGGWRWGPTCRGRRASPGADRPAAGPSAPRATRCPRPW